MGTHFLGGGSMAFNQKEWMAKMGKAQTTEEITALIMELPDGPRESEEGCESSMAGKGDGSVKTGRQDIPGNEYEPEDKRELYLLDGRTPVRCYDERDVYFYIPVYGKIGNDCINGIQITTMFVFMDYRFYEDRTHWFGTDGPLLFETKVYAKVPGVEVKYVPMFCSTWEEAEQMHQMAVERVRTTPLEILAHVYSHIYDV
jgi:hypothetical protein